jgi:hypothetical protein
MTLGEQLSPAWTKNRTAEDPARRFFHFDCLRFHIFFDPPEFGTRLNLDNRFAYTLVAKDEETSHVILKELPNNHRLNPATSAKYSQSCVK